MGSSAAERIAVVDLGSNSFRMEVFALRRSDWRSELERSSPVRIGEGLLASGRLGEAGMERGLGALEEFAAACAQLGLAPEQIDAVATSAIRDADNGADFLARVRERTGLDVRVLSREQEARYGYLAAVHSTTLRDGCVLDLGGGSLQLVRVAGRIARESGSWRLGAVRMTERFFADDGPARPAKRSQCKALQAHVARKLERGAPWLADTEKRLVGLGGTVRNLATAAERAAGVPSDRVHGFVLTEHALSELIERLAALPPTQRSSVPGIKPARADIVLAGALTIQQAMRQGGFQALEVTGAGLREGVVLERQLLTSQLDALRPARAA